MEKTRPDGLAVVMECSHFCMSWRGVREKDSKMLNSVMRVPSSKTLRCAVSSWP